MVSIYNEVDIIVQVIESLLDHGLEVVALDNGSTDKSYARCNELVARRHFTLQRWWPTKLDLERLTLRLYRMAAVHDPHWLVFSDGDEIMQTRQRTRTIRRAIEEADAAGYNLMQYNRFDFFWSDADDPTVADPVRRLRYYSWQGDFNYRAFKNLPGIRAYPSFAHYPLFPEHCPYRISPEKLVLGHYPYRSQAHAEAKIGNLVRRIEADQERTGWKERYLRIAAEGKHRVPADHRLLACRGDDKDWSAERLYSPFTDPQPTSEQLFTAEGFLRRRPAPTLDWDSELRAEAT